MQAEKLKWSAVQNDDRMALQLSGELVRDTLLPLWNEYEKGQQRFAVLAQSNQDLILDLSQISKIDSAGFALLCDILRHFELTLKGARIQLKGAPSQVLTLADLFGLEKWIKSFL